jgi:hypothetical protein
MSVFLEVIVWAILNKIMCVSMFPIPNGFRDRAVSLYKSLDLAPKIALHYRRTAPLYEKFESV